MLLSACDKSTNDVQKSIGQVKEMYPVTVNSGNHTTTVYKKPVRIVSLSPNATEHLSAINASSQVVATLPANAQTQTILDNKPDLVIAQSDAGNLVSTMQSSNVDVLIQPADSDPYKQIADLGVLTGHIDDAGRVAAKMRHN